MDSSRQAYLAGLIDGEGCIDIHQNNYLTSEHKFETYNLRVRVGMSTEEPIKSVQSWFGGGVNIINIRGHSSQFSLWWSGDKAMEILEAILPFLILKKKQAELGISFRAFFHAHHGYGCGGTPTNIVEKRREFYQQMKQLNSPNSI